MLILAGGAIERARRHCLQSLTQSRTTLYNFKLELGGKVAVLFSCYERRSESRLATRATGEAGVGLSWRKRCWTGRRRGSGGSVCCCCRCFPREGREEVCVYICMCCTRAVTIRRVPIGVGLLYRIRLLLHGCMVRQCMYLSYYYYCLRCLVVSVLHNMLQTEQSDRQTHLCLGILLSVSAACCRDSCYADCI